MKKKTLAILLSLCLLLCTAPAFAWAEDSTGGYCLHHTEHTDECEYLSNHDEDIDNPETTCNFICSVCPVQERIDALPDEEELKQMNDQEQKKILVEIEDIFAVIKALGEDEVSQLDKTALDAVASFFEEKEASNKNKTTVIGDNKEMPQNVKGAEKIEQELLNSHIVKNTVSPDHIKVNLFDYWLHGRDITDNGVVPGVPGTNSHVGSWTPKAHMSGINEDHALAFGVFGSEYSKWTGINQGPWTRSDGSGIVKNTLEDGYPVLNLTDNEVRNAFSKLTNQHPEFKGYQPPANESLAYLFDPNMQIDSKVSFEDVEGLFQISKDGNYYYDSKLNYAEVVEGEKSYFRLYDTPGVYRQASQIDGQFFPFNPANTVFEEGADGSIVGNKKSSDEDDMNHYFGLTLTSKFQQPFNGLVSNGADAKTKPMSFEFRGDDDVWIFIDDVLVADLGGIHDPVSTTIDFSTGKVTIRNSKDGVIKETTLKQQFEKAGKNYDGLFKEVENGNFPFNDRTVHELEMFYLERGNWDSSLELSFNLLEPTYSGLVKVNQDGEPLEKGEVAFNIFEADKDFNVADSADPINEKPLVIGEEGQVNLTFVDKNGIEQPIQFKDKHNYVLREVKTRPGYISTGDIHFTYQRSSNIITVENTWETGAVGKFKAQVLQAGELKYGLNSKSPGSEIVDLQTAKGGLIVAVPMLNTEKNENNTGATAQKGWAPMYGSPLNGYKTVEVSDNPDEQEYQEAALTAAVYQMLNKDNESWHLDYNEDQQRFEGFLNTLPGTANRYVFINEKDGDIVTAYYLLTGVFNDPQASAEEKIAELREALLSGGADQAGEKIENFVKQHHDGMRLLDLKDFNRLFYSQLYIPNKVRDLRVIKEDVNGNELQGAEFTLFETEACAKDTCTNTDKDHKCALAKGVTDRDGSLSFSIENTGGNAADGGELSSEVCFPLQRLEGEDGSRIDRSYWLKETKAPKGYTTNPKVVELRMTEDSFYANAGDKDDKISVVKGMGALVQTMHAFASDGEVDITLRDIIATMYNYDGDTDGDNLPHFNKWEKADGQKPLKLHYQLPGALLDYGIHKEGDIQPEPYFTADEDWVGFGVTQNYLAHTDDPDDEYYVNLDRDNIKSDLRGMDISALMTGTTTVVVGDDREFSDLTISKTVKGNKGDRDKAFKFNIEFRKYDKETLSFPDEFKYTGISNEADVDKPDDGTLKIDKNGKATKPITLKHGQGIVIKDIPTYTTYKVTETEANSDGYTTTVNGDKTPNDKAEGTILADPKAKAEFINTKDTYGSLEVTKWVAGEAGEKDKEFDFTVRLSDNTVNGKYGEMTFTDGIANFTLKHGESITATNLLTGIDYEVTETGENTDGYTTSYLGKTGTIKEEPAVAVCLNSKANAGNDPKEGDLIVLKHVSGEKGDIEKAFTFNIKLDDRTIDGKYGEVEFQQGKAIFALKHGESAYIAGLPAGVKYNITESDNEGYEVNSVGETGTIKAEKRVSAIFNNHKTDSNITPHEETPKDPGNTNGSDNKDGTKKPDVSGAVNENGQSSNNAAGTGDEANITAWVILLSISAIGIIAVLALTRLYNRRKSSKR